MMRQKNEKVFVPSFFLTVIIIILSFVLFFFSFPFYEGNSADYIHKEICTYVYKIVAIQLRWLNFALVKFILFSKEK